VQNLGSTSFLTCTAPSKKPPHELPTDTQTNREETNTTINKEGNNKDLRETRNPAFIPTQSPSIHKKRKMKLINVIPFFNHSD